MDLLIAGIRRHPIVVALCLVATVIGAATVWVAVPYRYEASASYAVLPPGTAPNSEGTPTKINSWQAAGGIPSQIFASSLVAISETDAFAKSLAAAGVTSDFSVVVEPAGGGVVLGVATEAADPIPAAADLTPLADGLRAALAAQQVAVDAPANTFLRLQAVTPQAPPVVLQASKVKLTGIAVALGLVLTLLSVVIAETRRRGVSTRARAHAGAPGAGLTPDDLTPEDLERLAYDLDNPAFSRGARTLAQRRFGQD